MALYFNNPGNIKLVPGTVWQGQVLPGDSSVFVTYINLPYGYRALFKVIQSKINRGLNTINSIIYDYAPPGDNNPTESYVNFIENNTGINRFSVINPGDLDSIKKIAYYISIFETGISPDKNSFQEGFNLFSGQSGEISPDNNLNLIFVAGISFLYIIFKIK